MAKKVRKTISKKYEKEHGPFIVYEEGRYIEYRSGWYSKNKKPIIRRGGKHGTLVSKR